MELNREEFEVLWKVEHSWENNPEYASDVNTNESIKKFTDIYLRLEEAQLIFIHISNNKIDSATLTEKGLAVLNDASYFDWAKELSEIHNLILQH